MELINNTMNEYLENLKQKIQMMKIGVKWEMR